MIQNYKQYLAAKKTLQEQRLEFRRLQNVLRIKPNRPQDVKRFNELQDSIFEQESNLKLYSDLDLSLIDLDLKSIESIGRLLVMGRISAGFTQHELASRLGMKRQQIARYEQSFYERASLKRIIRIAKELELTLFERQSTMRSRLAQGQLSVLPEVARPVLLPAPAPVPLPRPVPVPANLIPSGSDPS